MKCFIKIRKLLLVVFGKEDEECSLCNLDEIRLFVVECLRCWFLFLFFVFYYYISYDILKFISCLKIGKIFVELLLIIFVNNI